MERRFAATPIRFGVFEVDLIAGELRKRGIKIKLQDQPFRILALLLERPGEVVTRERLRETLWPRDTFVEFEHSINAAAAKPRHALGDSAENPRFVETVAKRGYRFIAPTDVAGGPNVGNTPAPKPQRTRISWRRPILVLSGTVLVIIATFTLVFRSSLPHQTPSLHALHRITSDGRRRRDS